MSVDSVRILVVDDSALYRQLVCNVLRKIPGTEVVGLAKNGAEALSLAQKLDPDLLTLDVCMPDVDGLEVLRELKRIRHRAKAVMLSSLTANGAQTTTDALFAGAFDFIHKPSGPDALLNRDTLLGELTQKIEAFRTGRKARGEPQPHFIANQLANHSLRNSEVDGMNPAPASEARYEAIVVGTSTGGPVALGEVLATLPEDFPLPVVVVQHMPPGYTHSLAERLNQRAEIKVVEAAEGMRVEAGVAYIAPGGKHVKLQRIGSQVILRINDDPAENCCRPSIDYLFRSASEVYHGRVVALVMTGMGRDGTEGCREIKRRGGYVIAQHPDGCTVYGMPKAIVEAELADQVIPLDRIGMALLWRIRCSGSAANR